jgi:hypothetical protein
MQRNKADTHIRGMNKTLDQTYNEQSGAFKYLGPILGCLSPLGAADAEIKLQRGSLVAFFNSDTAVHFVAFGSSGLAAPTDFTDGIALPPGQYTILSNGESGAALADDATVYAYLIKDDSFIS